MKENTYIQQLELASFGAVHLNVTNLQNSLTFWEEIGGMKIRSLDNTIAEIGTTQTTLVVLHNEAKMPFQAGYSGLYHFAIHVSNEHEFAQIVHNLLSKGYPFSPVDHVMSKSVYLKDPDGINIEFALETPERFKRVIATDGLMIEDAEGKLRPASDLLAVNELLQKLSNPSKKLLLSKDTKIGHFHFYAKNVEQTNLFYQNLGFLQFNYLPQFLYADLGAGGHYQHRIALNSWHGINKPSAPSYFAGLKYFELIYQSPSKLQEVLKTINARTISDREVVDPSGNKILLRC